MAILKRQAFLLGAASTGSALAMAAPAGAAVSYQKPGDWDRIVQAAKQEGTLVLYGPSGDSFYAALITRFQRAYPEIKIQSTLGVGAPLVARISAERAAGRNLADVFVNGSAVVLPVIKPQHGLLPLDPWLVLPEVRDRNAWLQNMLWYNDANAPYTNLSFAAIMYPIAYVNTDLAKVSQFKSYWDLVDSKWKGKITANDLRIVGPGGVPASYVYQQRAVGPQWFRRFYGDLGAVIGRDQRQLIDGLAQGRFAIAGFVSAEEGSRAIDQGLPIAPINPDDLREGAAIGPGAGTVSIFSGAPHPNAVKVYVNWLLSRDGQIAWQEETKYASLRSDVPKTNIVLAPRPGKRYANGGSEAYADIMPNVGAMLSDVLTNPGKR